MNDVALILAAHGSRNHPTVNARISGLARAFQLEQSAVSCSSIQYHESISHPANPRGLPTCRDCVAPAARYTISETGLDNLNEPDVCRFDETVAAFHQGEPGFADAIDSLVSTRVVVVPFFSSDGYFSKTVLPAAIAQSTRYREKSIRISPAVGTHSGTYDLVLARVENLLHEHQHDASETTLIIVGHGTKRGKGSALSTINLAAILRRKGLCASVGFAFLDQEPFIEQAMTDVATANVVAIPFFIGKSSHAGVDVPRQLGLELVEDESLPLQQTVNGISILCDVAVGTYPRMVEVIGALANEVLMSWPPRKLSTRAPAFSGVMA